MLTALLSEAHEIVSMMQEENEQMEAEAEDHTGSEAATASMPPSTAPSENGKD